MEYKTGNGAGDQYFATLSGEEFAAEVMQRVEHFDEYLTFSGKLQLWQRCYDLYYRGLNINGLMALGEKKEFTGIHINHFRNILRHILVTTTGVRPIFEPRAVNSDYKSRAQVHSCQYLLDYYYDNQDVETLVDTAVESALVFGEGFSVPVWDKFAGGMSGMRPVFDPATGQPMMDPAGNMVEMPTYAGDLRLRNVMPQNVIRDPAAESFGTTPWVIIREAVDRWDLAARYPKHKDDILAATSKHDKWKDMKLGQWNTYSRNYNETSNDVYVYTLYHRITPAMPVGRVSVVLDDQTLLADSSLEELGLPDIPVHRVVAGEVQDSPFGYSVSFDLLALQDLYNLLASTIATNQSNFGVACVQGLKGSGFEVTEVTRGLMFIQFTNPAGKLEPLQLGGTPAEIFNFLNTLDGLFETLSGVNSVARGNPEASLKSGAALALVQSQHIEFTKDLQKSYARLVSSIGTTFVRYFKKNVTSPRIAAIVGKAGRSYLREMAGSELERIDRVEVDMGTYLSRTPAGRVNLAEQLARANMIETPEQYLTVLSTGRLEPITYNRQATLDLIQEENEEILMGNNPPVMITDNHPLHILEHNSVSSNVEARKQPEVMQAFAAHMQQHIDMLKQLPPELAALLKMPALQGGPAPTQGAPGAEPQSPTGIGGAPAALGLVSGAQQAADNVNFPKNPLTNETWNPATGGLPVQ